MNEELKKVDHSALRINQALIITLNLLAFLLDLPWLVVIVALVMVLGTILKIPGFGFIYRYFLKPLGWVKPDILLDNPEPHRFAQGLGGIFMVGSGLALFTGLAAIGWGLSWLVSLLAALNLFAGFCVGCMFYYWLSRWKVPGFRKSPPEGTFPGMRPRTKAYES